MTENECILDYDIEPDYSDEVKCCPDCETPNQFGELCHRCIADMQEV